MIGLVLLWRGHIDATQASSLTLSESVPVCTAVEYSTGGPTSS